MRALEQASAPPRPRLLEATPLAALAALAAAWGLAALILPSPAARGIGLAAAHGGLLGTALAWTAADGARERWAPLQAALVLGAATLLAHLMPGGVVAYLAVPAWVVWRRVEWRRDGVRTAARPAPARERLAHPRVSRPAWPAGRLARLVRLRSRRERPDRRGVLPRGPLRARASSLALRRGRCAVDRGLGHALSRRSAAAAHAGDPRGGHLLSGAPRRGQLLAAGAPRQPRRADRRRSAVLRRLPSAGALTWPSPSPSRSPASRRSSPSRTPASAPCGVTRITCPSSSRRCAGAAAACWQRWPRCCSTRRSSCPRWSASDPRRRCSKRC